MDTDAIQKEVETFVKKMGITVESIEPVSVVAHQMFNIHTPDSKQLIGPQGEHLRSLNTILRRFVERSLDIKEGKFMVDVNGYQHTHIRELEQKASLLADRVKTFKSSADMVPMNPYERMIVHAMFSEDPEIETESEGSGKGRHVVLRYKTA
jgi:spoIIIJ-associated protein